ncbi:MAG TPA: hypothetical protein EYP04_08130 [Anaerolineae bacterium]|nr:hypothetical protein [Anaerolineae bacterium]
MTGLPGWMRFGYAPGWWGGRGGPGPCAYYWLTGQWPVPPAGPWTAPPSTPWWGWAGFQTPEEEIAALRAQAEQIKAQLDAIASRIAELEKQE